MDNRGGEKSIGRVILKTTKNLFNLPITDCVLFCITPLGNKWKSYSTPSTTTVCPALLPP